MQCEEVRDQFTDYLSEMLSERVRSDVQQHLIGCESCRDEAEALKSIWMKLDSIPSEKPDSTALRGRFEVMLEAYRQGMDHGPTSTWWSGLNRWIGGWWPHQPALQFGLTMILLAAGVIAGGQMGKQVPQPTVQQILPPPELAGLREELHDMRQMVAVSLMQQQSATERLKGVNWSSQIDQPDPEFLNALMDTLMHDANVNVRLAVVDALKKFGERQIVRKGVLQALDKQDSPIVQAALIDYVVEMQEKESVDTLRKISKDAEINETVRKRAEWGIAHLE